MVEIYCHSCSNAGTGYVNAENEVECMRCGSTFVEESGQEGLGKCVISSHLGEDLSMLVC